MRSNLFAALICLFGVTIPVERPTAGDGGTTPGQSRQQVASQSPASPIAAASTPAASASPAPSAAVNNSDPNADACKLLTSEEIQAVQGEGVKAAKGSDASTGAFAVSQCFYETASFTNSVSLTLTRKGGGEKGEGPREFWKKNFSGEKGRDKEEREKGEHEKAGGEKGEEEEGLPPTHVRGVGDDAYWVGNGKVGALYVLKGDKFIRISIGGGDAQEKKLEKSKTLAQRALKRI